MQEKNKLLLSSNWCLFFSEPIVALIFVAFLYGCGAKKPIIGGIEDKAILNIEKDESIAIVLGKFINNEFESISEENKGKVRKSVEKMLTDCLLQSLEKDKKKIPVISSESAIEITAQNYGFSNYEDSSEEIIDKLKSNNLFSKSLDNRLRYLLIADITTREFGDVEPTLDGDAGVFLVGVAKEGRKHTSANVRFLDLKHLSEAEAINVVSEGREGWAAGVLVLIILPVPYYIPWWSNTESEVCKAIGQAVANLIVLD